MMKITFQATTQVVNIEEHPPVTGEVPQSRRRARRGFTLLELLIVITIIGILAGILIPNLTDLVVSAEATKTQASFKAYLTALTQYEEKYNYYPPVFQDEEPVDLSTIDNRDKFIMALKGRRLVGDRWERLEGDDIKHNRNSRQFHPFASEEEFDSEGYLVDAWGSRYIKIIVDYDRDGFIELPVDSEVSELDGRRIKENIVIYVLSKDDPNGFGEDVFSWPVKED